VSNPQVNKSLGIIIIPLFGRGKNAKKWKHQENVWLQAAEFQKVQDGQGEVRACHLCLTSSWW